MPEEGDTEAFATSLKEDFAKFVDAWMRE